METKRLNINKLSDFPVISEQEQMEMKGGTTQAELDAMISNGTWQGGYVDGLGYVSKAVVVEGFDLQKWSQFFYQSQPYNGSIGESDSTRWDRMNELNKRTGGYDPGIIREWLIRRYFF